jgi:acyl carrier protein
MLDTKEFLENFELQFDEVDSNSLTMETVYKDIPEWSSLSALLVIAMISTEYDVVINGDTIRNSNTIGDLFEFVKSKK